MAKTAKEEITEIVDDMKATKTFSFLDAVREQSYPTGKVAIYLNGEAAGELNELYEDRKIEIAEGALASAELNEIETEIVALEEVVRKSRLIVHMRGVAPKVRRIIGKEAARKFKIEKSDTDDEALNKSNNMNLYVTYELLRHSIVKVEAPDGSEDTSALTYEDIEVLDNTLVEQEFNKLDSLCAKLSGAAYVFNESLDADFLSKS